MTASEIKRRASSLGYSFRNYPELKVLRFMRQLQRDMIFLAEIAHEDGPPDASMTTNQRNVFSWILRHSSSKVTRTIREFATKKIDTSHESPEKLFLRRTGILKPPEEQLVRRIRETTVNFDAVLFDLSKFTSARWRALYQVTAAKCYELERIYVTLPHTLVVNRLYPAFSYVLANRPSPLERLMPMCSDGPFAHNDQNAIRALLNLGYFLGEKNPKRQIPISCLLSNPSYKDPDIYSPAHGKMISYQEYLAFTDDLPMMEKVLMHAQIVNNLRKENSPLSIACFKNRPNLAMVELLLRHGANPNAHDNLVHHVVSQGKVGVLLLFIKYSQNSYGILKHVVNHGTPEMLREVLEFGIEYRGWTLQNVHTTLDYAERNRKREMVEVCRFYIQENGSEMRAISNKRSTTQH